MPASTSYELLLRPRTAIVFVFTAMLLLSWRRWTGVIIDIGRETDLPLRILNGEVLYRDIHYTYTPFAPYFNALLYRILGVHLDTLVLSGIVCSAVVVILSYRISRKLMPETEASITASFVAVLCVFKPFGALILPYSFGGLYAAIFALATVLFLLRFAGSGRRQDLMMAGIFAGLAAVSKQELGIAAAATIFAYTIFRHRRDLKAVLQDLAYGLTPALLIVIPTLTLLFAYLDWRLLIYDCHLFLTNIPPSLLFYNRFRSGLDRPLVSAVQMMSATALSTLIVLVVIVISDRSGHFRSRLVKPFLIAFALFAAGLTFYKTAEWYASPLRAIPVLLIGIIVWEWRRGNMLKTDGLMPSHGLPAPGLLFILAAFSFMALFRMILRVPSGGVTSAFYLPAALCLVYFALLRALPAFILARTGNESSFQRARLVSRAICILAITGMMISFGIRYRTKMTYPIDAPRGRLVLDKVMGPVYDATLDLIESHTQPGEIIAVLPEGSDMAFLTGRRVTLRHQVFFPDFLSPQDELDAIATLERDKVRYIFIGNRPMREFGAVAFGTDFYTTLQTWIDDNYELVRVIGGTENVPVEIGKGTPFFKVYQRKGT